MFRKNNFVSLFVATAMCVLPARAQSSNGAGAFLELGIGARSMAMGEAYVSVADDGSAFYWNPAGVATVPRAEVSGMYASLFKSLASHFHLGFTRPLSGSGAISINWIRLSVSDIPRFDSPLLDDPNSSYDTRVDESTRGGDWEQFALTASALGVSNSTDDALFISLSRLNKLNIDFGWQYFVVPIMIPVGMNIKLIRQSLFENKGSGIGIDLGAMLKFGVDDLFDNNSLGKFSIGIAARDVLNTKITWNTDSRHADHIARTWNIGASYLQPLSGLSSKLLFSYAFQRQYDVIHQVGMEYLYYNRLAIRFGLADEKFTAGIGFGISVFHLDYAFRSHELGGTHRINTSIKL